MGLYIWIALGFAVGSIGRLLTPGRTHIHWLETIVVGIAGGVAGGWGGSQIWQYGTIDYLGWPAMIAAVVGSAILVTGYVAPKIRKSRTVIASSNVVPRSHA
jgi:uncharacterized membrane protein YeaQ/YmgE (transglycosylase-associated protein family)